MGGTNRISRNGGIKKSLFPSALKVIDATVSFNQGDLLVFDDTNTRLKVPVAEAEGSTFLGIAEVTVVLGKLATPYLGTAVDAANAISDIPGPAYSVIAKLVLKTGITINPGDPIFLDPATGVAGVTNTGTKQIGTYQGAAITTAPAGTIVECLLGCRHPSDTLTF